MRYPFSTAVAKNLYKVMAYKDEYEVARLYSNGDFMAQLKKQFEGDFQLRFHLAAPIMMKINSGTGLPVKRTFSQWILPLFSLLARLKFLRGTLFDVFAHSAERNKERQWRDEYEKLLTELIAGLTRDNLAVAIELAGLPERIRGFGHVKASNLLEAKRRKLKLLKQFHGDLINAVEVVDPESTLTNPNVA